MEALVVLRVVLVVILMVEQIQGSAEIRQAVIDTAIAAGETVRNRNEYN